MLKFSRDRTYNWLLAVAWLLNLGLCVALSWWLPADVLGVPYVALESALTALLCLVGSCFDRHYTDVREAAREKLEAHLQQMWRPKA